MSFWTGERMEAIARKMNSEGMINQAHSGYLEQYMNLGYVGVGFIAIILISGLIKVRKHLDIDPSAAMLRLCFILTAVFSNYTEASFYGINNMWVLLLLGVIDVSNQQGAILPDDSRQNEQEQKSVFAVYRYKKPKLAAKHK
jgi:hypothetical protein